ncbi:MAG TPA: Clp protease N-terminal domain-containing protein [Acidimicrobiales bacterium]|jgi:ATP-dependent Clp protease ATP-binding subunit ClpC
MFERFTDRARRVLVVAQEEARDFGHPFIRPEHIGLGLLQNDGAAARALADLGVTYAATRDRVLAAFPAGAALAGERLPFTPEAKKVLELSLREALQLGHNYIGTEHLLLGLLRKDESLAPTLFQADPELLRARAVQYATGASGERSARSPALHAAVGRAQVEAGDQSIGTGQLLVAIAADPESQGAQVLARLGVTERAIADALEQVPLEGTSDALGPPRWFEIKLGGRTATVEDAELTRVLSELDAEQIRAVLRKGLGQQEQG